MRNSEIMTEDTQDKDLWRTIISKRKSTLERKTNKE